MLGRLLPRHLRIIYDLNARFLAQVHAQFPDDNDLLRRVSLIDERGQRRVRMAYISVLASHKVNGVSALHSKLMIETIFSDFARIFPGAVLQQNQRHHATALVVAGQPAAGCTDRQPHWHHLAAQPGRTELPCASWPTNPSSTAPSAWPRRRTSAVWPT
jgi:hypothetical protein